VTAVERARWSRRPPPELWLALAACLVMLVLQRAFVADDALISLRYARHLAEGHGLTFNPGEDPVEGYSNFTHVLVAAAAIFVGLPPLDVVRALNWGAALAVVVLVHALVTALGGRRATAGGAALTAALHPPLAHWAASGLETALAAALWLAAVRAIHARPAAASTGLVAFALAATRPEGALLPVLALPILYLSIWFARDDDDIAVSAFAREHGRWLAVFGATYGAYFAWRIGWFGHALPASVLYKADADQPGILLQEFAYQTLPVLVLAGLAPFARLGRTAVLLSAIVVAHAAILYDAARSVADLHRFFLPIYPCVIVLAALAIEHRVLSVRRFGPALAAGAASLALCWQLGHPVSGLSAARARSERLAERLRVRVTVAEVVLREADPGAAVATGDVGALGYLLDAPLHDLFGLNSEEFARDFRRERRPFVRRVMERRPPVLALVSRDPERFDPRWATDGYALGAPGATGEYGLWVRVRSRAEPYHSFVYRHGFHGEPRDVPVREEDAAAAVRRVRALARSLR
jgi:hypothetical protein